MTARVFLICVFMLASTGARAERVFWVEGDFDTRMAREARITVRAMDGFAVLLTEDTTPWVAGAQEVVVPAGADPFLLRLHDASDEASLLASEDVTLLRRHGEYALVAIDAERIPNFAGCLGERLIASPVQRSTALLRKRQVDPNVKSNIVDAVDEDTLFQIVGQLSGAVSFELNGMTRTNDDRNTYRPGSDIAADFLEQEFEAMGYSVLRQDFTVFGDPTQNVVAIKTGQLTPEEVVVVGGHYDSISNDDAAGPAPGAEDNGSGTAAVLHLAEIFAPYQTDRTIHFVAFGGEEQGLFGSQHYVTELLNQGTTFVGALTMDMISAYDSRYQIDIEGLDDWPELNQLMDLLETNVASVAPALATEQKFFSFGSDHVPFQQAGVPAFLAIESDYADYPGYHRTTDTREKLASSLGRDVTRAMAATLADLTNPTLVETPVLVSGLEAAWRLPGARVLWEVRATGGIAGFLLSRSDGYGPSAPITDVLPPELGTMKHYDPKPPVDDLVRAYELAAILANGERQGLASTTLTPPPPSSWLAQNTPNPFNPRTEIAFSLPAAGPVRLEIFDVTGRRIRMLVEETAQAGPRVEVWDGNDEEGQPAASGVFYYSLRTGASVLTRRMVLLR